MFSIVVNCYNGSKYLKDTMSSILNINYNNYEVIFFDNNSTDDSVEIVKKFNSKKVRIFENTKNISLGHARRKAVEKIQGDYICFIDSDDIIHEDTLNIYEKLFNKINPDIIYGGVNYIDSSGNYIGKYSPVLDFNKSLNSILVNFDVNVSSWCLKKDVFTTSKILFDPEIYCCEEFDIMVRSSAMNLKIISVDKILSSYRIHKESITANKLDVAAKERRYILNKIREKVSHNVIKNFEYAYYKSYYYDSLYLSKNGDFKGAKIELRKALKYSLIFKFLYFILLISPAFWLFIHRLKGRKILKI